MRLKKIIFSGIFWKAMYFATVLLLNIIISRYFKAAGSGWIYYIINVFSLVILLVSCSLESGITFFGASNTIGRNKLAVFAIVWSGALSLLVSWLAYFFFKHLHQPLNRNQFTFFSGAFTLGMLLVSFFTALFNVHQHFTLPNILLTSTNLLLSCLFIAIIIYRDRDSHDILLNLYFTNFLLQGILMAGMYFVNNDVFKSWSLPEMPEVRVLIRYSVFALLANIVFFLLYRVDYWFVKNSCLICNEQDLGNYIQVSKLGQLFLLLPVTIAGMLFPRTAGGFATEVNAILPLLSRVLFSMYIIMLMLLSIVGYWLFPFVYGETFQHMYVPFLLLIPGLLGLSSLAFISAYYAGKDKILVNLKGSSIALAVILIGDIIFIPHYGIKAAALASSVAYLACYFYSLLIFRKNYAVPLKHFFVPERNDFKIALRYVIKQFNSAKHNNGSM